MYRLIILIFIVSTTVFSAFGQTNDGIPFLQGARNTTPLGQAPPPGTVGNVEGTPYLYENYQPGAIVMSNGNRVELPVNYDALNYEVVVMHQTQAMALPFHQVAAFFLQSPKGDTLEFRRAYDLPGGSALEFDSAQYVRVLYRGKLSLIAQHRATFLATSNQTTYNNGRQEPEYKHQPTRYFLIQDGQKPLQAKLRKGWVFKQFPDQKSAIKEALSQQNWDLREEEGFASLIEWLDL